MKRRKANLHPDDIAELLNPEPKRSVMALDEYITAGRIWRREGKDAAWEYLVDQYTAFGNSPWEIAE